MLYRNSLVLPFILLGSVGLLTTWLSVLTERVEVKSVPLTATDFDFTVERFHAVQYAPTGLPKFVLQAGKLVHFPQQRLSRLESVSARGMLPNKPDMTVTANYAQIYGKGEVIDFPEQVLVTQAATARAPALLFNGRQVVVDVNQHLVSSDAPVHATQGNQQVDADRFSYHQAVGQWVLSGRVRAVYQPPLH